MSVASVFFEYAIFVNRLSVQNQFPNGTPNCFTITVPAADYDPGIPNSDLHLYVDWENVGSGTYIATSGYCVLNAGPRFGLVNFNVGSSEYSSFTSTDYEFDRNLEITIHYITHVLGFSAAAMEFWFQPGTTTFYGASLNTILTTGTTVRGISTTNVLSSPNVLQAA
jgi:hypothetical protein